MPDPMTQERLDSIKARCEAETPNPVRYYHDGQPYVSIDGIEICNHPLVDKLAEYDRHEKYVLPALLAEIERLRAERRWIPVEERYPTAEDADRYGFIAAHSPFRGNTVCVWHHILNDGVTTHWMPLPDPIGRKEG